MTIKLRPHHLLCIQKYTGHGYDERFTAHMTGVVSRLQGTPSMEIMLVQGCDELCVACPNSGEGICISLEKVEAMDAAVLDQCSLLWGCTVSWSEVSRIAREKILQSGTWTSVCVDCQWFNLCAETEISYDENHQAL